MTKRTTSPRSEDRGRAVELAQRLADLAAGARVELPSDLQLWRIAGGRPRRAAPDVRDDPAAALGDALEATLAHGARRRGAHFTPSALAARVADLALAGAGSDARVVDPACGGGALLLAAGRLLVARGGRREAIARDQLYGADLDPVAAAVTEAAIALWSGGVAPHAGRVVVADSLRAGKGAWTDGPRVGFDAVVANPPFQAQLARDTARSDDEARVLRGRFGHAWAPYVDTAALFLLVAVELLRPGARAAVVQPQSVAGSRDAGPVRQTLAGQARLAELWVPEVQPFAARVHVCVPVLVSGDTSAPADAGWARALAVALGVPAVDLPDRPTISSIATLTAGFRDEYYGLVPHVREASATAAAPLVTSGAIGVGRCDWGERPLRFAKATWQRPDVDVTAAAASSDRLAGWLTRVRQPKVVVATQTQVVEAATDRAGTWVPVTPVIAVVPHDAADLDRLAAALCSPVAAAVMASQAAGTALSPRAIRVSASLAGRVTLPVDRVRWDDASRALSEGDLVRFAELATGMHRLSPASHDAVVAWWLDRTKTGLAPR